METERLLSASPMTRWCTTCEVIIAGQPGEYARQAADAAFDELDRWSGNSAGSSTPATSRRSTRCGRANRSASGRPREDCLQLAARLHGETGGAFDVTLGTGLHLLALNPAEHSVAVVARAGAGPRSRVDLGGIGKGYAVDQMVAILRDWKIDSALVHTGQSSVFAVGVPAAPGPPLYPPRGGDNGGAWPLRADRPAGLGDCHFATRRMSPSRWRRSACATAR